MASSKLLSARTPRSLKFNVDYYDETHKALLAKTKHAEKLEKFVSKGITIPTFDFLTYSVFRHQKNKAGWRTYREMRAKLPKVLPLFSEYFDVASGTPTSVFADADDRDISQTESAGVGVSLSIVSQLYDLTEADWERIPVRQKKDLDFLITSDGAEVVEVEAKGTVGDPSKGSSTISKFKSHIEAKKRVRRADKSPPSTLIGVIAIFPTESTQLAHIKLLDPPRITPVDDPQKYRLLSRLTYYWTEFNIISSARFLIALVNKLQDVALAENYMSLGGTPLLGDGGADIERPGSLFATRSFVAGNLAVGEVVPGEKDEWYFYGMDSAVLPLLLSSDFVSLLTFSSTLPTQLIEEVTIIARLRLSDVEERGIDRNQGRIPSAAARLEFVMRGTLFANSAGRVFGRVRFAAVEPVSTSVKRVDETPF